jgi:LysM repeat protein
MSYTVKAGDTLFSIAQSHGISLEKLQAANPGVDPTKLQVGQVLKLPSSGGSGSPQPPKGGNGYVQYSGPASHFPKESEWASWDTLWKINERLMKLHDSDSEVALINKSIQTVAKESGVDRRVILCIIVQESGGNVRVKTVSEIVNESGVPAQQGIYLE